MYYKQCPYCGCNLDPGETCDCTQEAEAKAAERQRIHDKVQARIIDFWDKLKREQAQEQAQQEAARALKLEEVRADLLRSIRTTAKSA